MSLLAEVGQTYPVQEPEASAPIELPNKVHAQGPNLKGVSHHGIWVCKIWSLQLTKVPKSGDFFGGPVVKTLPSNAGHAGPIPAVRELRSHMPCSAKKVKIKVPKSKRQHTAFSLEDKKTSPSFLSGKAEMQIPKLTAPGFLSAHGIKWITLFVSPSSNFLISSQALSSDTSWLSLRGHIYLVDVDGGSDVALPPTPIPHYRVQLCFP